MFVCMGVSAVCVCIYPCLHGVCNMCVCNVYVCVCVVCV